MSANQLLWDDLKTVLAIARAGSLSGAKRELGVSHATVFRRLEGIERRLGVRLFDRSRTGYAPTVAGEDIATTAKRMEVEVMGVERRIAGKDLVPGGTVRVTTTDALLNGLLSPILADFQGRYPDILLEVVVSNHLFNLSNREADVAIRPSNSPPEQLVGRKAGVIEQAVYGHSDRLAASTDCRNSAQSGWIGPDKTWAYQPLDNWMASHGLDSHCRYRADTLMGMWAATRAGIGLSVLPCYLGDRDARLSRVSDTIPELASELWLLTHTDLRHVTRIRAFMKCVAESTKNALSGSGGHGP